ncbi:MAG: hypothetical protein QNL88_07740 [Acidobacteriota bacterium]|nr:hypothetical protein [Acidobacteriota bacterium]
MQNKNTILSIALAIIVMTSWTAAAQGRGGGGGQGHQPPTPAIDTVLDVDGDEMISGEEIANAAAALVELDADYDGGLSFDECMGFSAGGGQQTPPAGRGDSGGKPPEPPIFSTLDAGGDGVVDANEIVDAPSSLLELDSNGDGQLQPDEYRPSHAGGRPPRDR